MRAVLWVAAVYNLVWGAAVVLFPNAPFRLAGMTPTTYPQIWQCVGMIVGVYGVAYALAARDPLRHWQIVLVGLLGKVLGPIGFVYYAARGELPWISGLTCVFNDLIWWVPFGLILLAARREMQAATVDHIAIVVEDIPAAIAWYQSRFRCPVEYQDDTWAMLRFQNVRLALVVPHQHPAHIGFVIPDAEKYGTLRPHRDGSRSIYLPGPSGNMVEILAPYLRQ